MPLRISIVEDDQLTRETLVKVINSSPQYECIAAYGSAEEALREIPGHLPDVILMDIELPGKSGIECTAALKTAHPGLQILIVTTYDDSELIFNALRSGADGYLLKRSRPAAILRAIAEVHRGGAPMSTNIARLVVSHFYPNKKITGELETLSPREREVLEQLAKGSLYKEVADLLGISMSTVNSHVESIYRKLHVQTRTEAVLKLRDGS